MAGEERICAVCRTGRITVLGPLIVCANCGKAWAYHEYIADARKALEAEHGG
jgi:hypothetical protein